MVMSESDVFDAVKKAVESDLPPTVCQILAELPVEIRCLRDDLAEYKRELESLTPGGSEFVGDPKRCAAVVKETRNSLMDQLVKAKQQLAEAKEKLTRMPCGHEAVNLKCITEWAGPNGAQDAPEYICQVCEANAARERALAKCAVAPDAPKSWVLTDENWSHILKFAKQYAEWRGQDNPGQPLLDKLARVEAENEELSKRLEDLQDRT